MRTIPDYEHFQRRGGATLVVNGQFYGEADPKPYDACAVIVLAAKKRNDNLRFACAQSFRRRANTAVMDNAEALGKQQAVRRLFAYIFVKADGEASRAASFRTRQQNCAAAENARGANALIVEIARYLGSPHDLLKIVR